MTRVREEKRRGNGVYGLAGEEFLPSCKRHDGLPPGCAAEATWLVCGGLAGVLGNAMSGVEGIIVWAELEPCLRGRGTKGESSTFVTSSLDGLRGCAALVSTGPGMVSFGPEHRSDGSLLVCPRSKRGDHRCGGSFRH
jgi:hypothetical protein